MTENEGVRLQKALANAGVASRRVAEQLIAEGRVRGNGRIVDELGSRLDPETDLVDVAGTAVAHTVFEDCRAWLSPSDHVPIMTEFAF